MKKMWMPLTLPGLRRLLAGQVLSDFANWLDFVALSAIIVYTWGHGSLALALLSVCIGLPWVVVGPLLAGRMGSYSGKKVLVVCDILRASILLFMIVAPNLAVLLPLVFLKMSVSSVFDPVRQRAIRHLVKEDDMLAQVSSLSQLSVSTTKIIGPMAGGFCVAMLGKESAFLAGAIFYLLSAWILSALPAWKRDMEAGSWTARDVEAAGAADTGRASAELAATTCGLEKPHVRKQRFRDSSLGSSWSYIASKPLLKAAILYSACMFFLIFLYDGLIVLWVKDTGMAEDDFGLLIGAVGGGSVLGALAAGRYTGWREQPLARMAAVGMLSGLLIAVTGLGSFGLLPPVLAVWMPLFGLIGFLGAQSTVPFSYVLQTETTEAVIGPVSAFASAMQTASMLVAPFLGALAAEQWNTGGVFIVVGAVSAVLASGCWLDSMRKKDGGIKHAPEGTMF